MTQNRQLGDCHEDREIIQRREVLSLSPGEGAGVRASVNTNSTENVEGPKKLFLDENWQVSFHKPVTKAAVKKVHHA
jgi:hypothetical protein